MIGVLIPTYRSRDHLKHCIPPLLRSTTKPRVLVIDSSSSDGTVEEAERLGAETRVIPQSTFNHGLTRELGRQLLGTEIVVMMTPDAYPKDASLLETLVEPLQKRESAIAYARQLPRPGAGPLEAFPRLFNYPAEGHRRTLDDLGRYGIFTFFCSDSCAAYCSKALDKVGGFPECQFGEDTLVTARLLRAGMGITYVAEAQVYHSHAFSLCQEYRRYREIGLLHGLHGALLAGATGRGCSYVRALRHHLMQGHRRLLPYAALQCAVKWTGYRLGRRAALRKLRSDGSLQRS